MFHQFASHRVVKAAVILMTIPLLWCGCRSTPITGRKQVLLIPEHQEIAMGIAAYQEVLQNDKPSENLNHVEIIKRVGRRIAAVAGRPDYDWEFFLIQSGEQNAFCLPGGKVAVYEGILPICQNEAGLAVVMSHEIAHALARHGGERMTHGTIVNGLQQAVSFVLEGRDQKEHDTLLAAYGVASQYGVILPYSRRHETEADQIGIRLMAQAGYEPGEAPRFWERFVAARQTGRQTEFLSTHPSDERRAANLRELLPEATTIYKQAPTRFGLGEPLM